MSKSRSSKRALLLSALAMLVCLAMFVGSTFAWFTDSASTSVNSIVAGELKIDIQNAAGESVKNGTLAWQKAQGHEEEKILWEPNCTYSLEPFRIVNLGTLALKYRIEITGFEGDRDLLDVISFEYTEGGAAYDLSAERTLKKGEQTGLITMTGHMDENAGNHYQGMTLENIAITVYATQAPVEADSIDNTYDKDANGNPDHPDWSVTANVTAPVAPGEDTLLENADQTVSLLAPAGSTDASELTLAVEPAKSPAGVTVASDQSAKTYEVKLLDENGNAVTAKDGALFTAKIFIGKNLTGVRLFHKDVAMPADSFQYDSATGEITFQTASFSPYTAVYDKVVARIGDTYYETLADAIAAVEENGTIDLVENVSICESTSTAVKKGFVLNGNGHKLSADNQLQLLSGKIVFQNVTFTSPRPLYVQGAAFVLEETATIDSKVNGNAAIWFYGNAKGEINGKVLAPNAYGVCLNTDAKFDSVPNTVTLNGAMVDAGGPALYVNGSFGGHSVTAVKSTFISADQGLYVSGQLGKGQTVSLTGCTVKGTTAIEVKHSDLTVADCALIATGDPTQYAENNNGGTAIGYCLATTSNSKNGKIEATSGTVTISNTTYSSVVPGCEVFNSAADADGSHGAVIEGYDLSRVLYPGKLTPNA